MSGLTVYDRHGNPMELQIMDDHDEILDYIGSPERGFYAYEGAETRLTVFVEE